MTLERIAKVLINKNKISKDNQKILDDFVIEISMRLEKGARIQIGDNRFLHSEVYSPKGSPKAGVPSKDSKRTSGGKARQKASPLSE